MEMPYSFTSLYFDSAIIPQRVLDIFRPAKITRPHALYFIHGGGWHSGSRAIYHKIMHAFSKEGFVCAATDYRLTGVTLADQLTDLRHGYDVFTNEIIKINRKPQIIIYGSSAGAHLAALLAFAGPADCGDAVIYENYSPSNIWKPPAAAMLLSFTPFFTPWNDIFPGIWKSMQNIAGASYTEDPEYYKRFSPIEYIGDYTPPVFIAHAENEHMFPYENLLLFKEKMTLLNRYVVIKTYTKAEHGFFYDITRRQQKELFADILDFINTLQ
ncbi:MAG: hypothetical protein A2096_10465 [Spirochaetes bacterium GWF1_41_5]|nr:MAG: hypothetical protein A2096_10465 [Spirochaetes bacterium GWF1_41_5]